MIKINITSITQKIIVATTNIKSLENLAYGTALSKIADRKRKLINKFEEHDVTKEIRAGASASSKFLDEGNLNSFIGFYPGKGELQLDNIKQSFESIRVIKNAINKRKSRNGAFFDFRLQLPTLKSIWDKTSYPTGNDNIQRDGSWADNIETRGVGGLEYYIYLFSKTSPSSRSGKGLQLNKGSKYRSGLGGMGRVSYIRDLLNNFIKSAK